MGKLKMSEKKYKMSNRIITALHSGDRKTRCAAICETAAVWARDRLLALLECNLCLQPTIMRGKKMDPNFKLSFIISAPVKVGWNVTFFISDRRWICQESAAETRGKVEVTRFQTQSRRCSLPEHSCSYQRFVDAVLRIDHRGSSRAGTCPFQQGVHTARTNLCESTSGEMMELLLTCSLC